MSEQPLDEEAIFKVACQIETPAARVEYLNQACGDNAAVLERIAALLRVYELESQFLESPAPGLANTLMVAQPTNELPGAQIGPYKLLQQIGEGGMGTVYMAEQNEPVKRRVALKIIKPGMDSSHVLARFEAEKQALALMDHANIARVLDAGSTEQGRPYFVMELVHGVRMTKYCDDNHLTLRQRLELFVPVCQAIQHAHQKGIIHRDIKPSNVMITLYDGKPVPKVIDFGVAKATEQKLTERTLFTQYGMIVGTLEYMSPEQAEMSALGVDTRSDIYSLGVLLYELLTGSTPLSRERMKEAALGEILRLIMEEEPPKPSTRLSESGEALASISAMRQIEPAKLSKLMRGELDWIVMKCLEKDRSRRYETANGFAADVQRYLNDEPVEACPPSTGYRLRKFLRRNKRPVLAAVLLLVALVGGITATTWQLIRATVAEQLAETRLDKVNSERARAVEAVSEGKHRLYQARSEQAKAGRWSGQQGQRHQSLDALAEAARLCRELELDESNRIDLRNEVIACLALPDVRPIGEVSATWPPWHGDPTLTVRKEPQDGGITIVRLADNKDLARLTGEITAGAIFTFSPGGDLLAVRYPAAVSGQATNLEVWDWRHSKVIFQSKFAVFGDALRFSPDGRSLALGQKKGVVTVHQMFAGTENSFNVGLQPTYLSFRPDGGQLAVSSHLYTNVNVYELPSGRLVASLPHPSSVWETDWHPDGTLLATACSDHQVYLCDVPQNKIRAALRGHQNIVYHVSFSPDGNWLMSTASDGVPRLWDPWTQQQVLALPDDGFGRFNREGLVLAHKPQDNLGIWELAAPREFHTVPVRESRTRENAVTPLVSNQGLWLAMDVGGGAPLWNHLGKETLLSAVPSLLADGIRVDPQGGEAFFSEPDGLYSRSIQPAADSVHIGPPRKLFAADMLTTADQDRRGEVLAFAGKGGGWIKNRNKPADAALRFEHPGAFYVAVSPNGQWVASAPYDPKIQNGFGTKIWDARNGELECELLPNSWVATVAFSPDDRWLVTTTWEECTFWEVGTWKLVRRFPCNSSYGAAAFSANGKIAALKTSYETVQLVNCETGIPFAQVHPPQKGTVSWIALTPDGSKLVAGLMGQTRAIGTWDLRAIRNRLAELGLDWDQPPYPPASSSDEIKPVRVEVELGADVEGRNHEQAGRWRQAVEAYSKAIEQDPANPLTRRSRAEFYLKRREWKESWSDLSLVVNNTGEPVQFAVMVGALQLMLDDVEGYQQLCRKLEPQVDQSTNAQTAYIVSRISALADEKIIDPAKVVDWAERAALGDRNPWTLHALGRAKYRAGQFDESIGLCKESLEKDPNWPGRFLNWLILAMACHRHNQHDEALQWLAKAVQWQNQLAKAKDEGPTCPPNLDLADWIEFHVLFREVSALLKASAQEK